METEAIRGRAPDLMTAAFLSMQPPSTVVSFAREVGAGFVTSLSQKFFLDNCFNNEVHLQYPSNQSYVKRVVKAIIMAAERDGYEVMEDLYELYSVFLDLDKGLLLADRCYTTLTFKIPECARSKLAQTLGEEMASDLIGPKLLTLRISLDILDGDTGYNIWPAGLFLAQVLLSHPELVHRRSCIELGSGTGICGIWLSMLAPSKAVLTDGSLSTLANLRHNLEINGIPLSHAGTVQETRYGEIMIDARQLLWDTASEEELLSFRPQVMYDMFPAFRSYSSIMEVQTKGLGSDLIYDITVVPHLVRVLAIMLQRRSLSRRSLSDERHFEESRWKDDEVLGPVAYIASALRNLATLHLFFKLAETAGLQVTDVTEPLMPLRILPDGYDGEASQARQIRKAYSGLVNRKETILAGEGIREAYHSGQIVRLVNRKGTTLAGEGIREAYHSGQILSLRHATMSTCPQILSADEDGEEAYSSLSRICLLEHMKVFHVFLLCSSE